MGLSPPSLPPLPPFFLGFFLICEQIQGKQACVCVCVRARARFAVGFLLSLRGCG